MTSRIEVVKGKESEVVDYGWSQITDKFVADYAWSVAESAIRYKPHPNGCVRIIINVIFALDKPYY
jgi:hypothetical protein